MLYEVRSDLEQSRQLGERLLTLAQEAQDRAHLLQAHMALAVTSLSLGAAWPQRANTRSKRLPCTTPGSTAAKRISTARTQESGGFALAFGAVALWLLGYPDQGSGDGSREAVAVARGAGPPHQPRKANCCTAGAPPCSGSVLSRRGRHVQRKPKPLSAIAAEHGVVALAGQRPDHAWVGPG